MYLSTAAKLTQISEKTPLVRPNIQRALQRNNEANNGSYPVQPKITLNKVAVNITP